MSIMDLLAEGGQPAPAQPPEQPDAADHSTLIRDILDQVRQAAQEADDEQEALTWEKVSTMVQQILAAQQKQDEELMQGKLNPSALRRALG